jgi:hypothetical protein
MKSNLLLLIATSCVVSPLSVTAQTPVLLRTFNNPTPAAFDNFGSALAPLGNDRVLIGARYDDTFATNAGAVYLFHTNGTLLTTFTNPPTFGGVGNAITTLGSDRVVIASGSGCVLFTTNGTLVQTFSAPQPSVPESVVAFGNDKLLVGDHLYNTNGALLAAFTNKPSPGASSVAALGSDRVIIGVGDYPFYDLHGGVYLFNTNGTLLRTITNPTPAADALFGASVAAVDTDRILVGAYGDDPLGSEPGLVYVYSTNGTLLNTITNPTPENGAAFGAQIVVLGKDRLVISAPRDSTTGFESGSAYVFDINGTLLATINNPAPAIYDYFGWSMAAFGSEGVIIGAPGATNAGSAYLFSVPAPPSAPLLAIQLTTPDTVTVSWPSPSTGFVLQQNTNGVSSVNWSNITTGIQNDGTTKTLVINPASGARFYRLVIP